MTMNNVKQIFQNKFTNLGGKLKLDKNEDLSLPPCTEILYQTAKTNKEIYNDIYKKMASVCVVNYSTTDDKKTKKNSWESLSAVVTESEKKVAEDSLTKDIFTASIRAFDDLSRNSKDFERSLSSNVIKYFQDLSEDNNLSNMKKTISSRTKEMKANSERYQNLHEQMHSQSGDSTFNRKSMDVSNIGSAENKLASALLAGETSEKELDISKDSFLSKLFCSEAEQLITAEKMLEFFKEHLEYYIECKNILTKFIPEIQTIIDNNRKNYVFHLPLEEHVSTSNQKLSSVLETCIQALDNEETLQEEGLFRISGSKNKLDLLKNALNVMKVDEYIKNNCDSAVYAGVLKQYLRELPIPLMTFTLYDKWCEVGTKIRQSDVEGAKALIKECLTQMPPCYYDNLVYLMQFLKKIALNESVNKMNSSNLALMLGPNLIRNKSNNENDDSDVSRVMMLGSPGPGVVDFMITFFYELFPDVPVYTASKSKVHGKLAIAKTSDKELDRPSNLKSPRANADNSSLSSAEILSEDSSCSINELSSNLKSDQSNKSSKDAVAVLRPKMPRKPLAPPPPLSKPAIPEIEIENESNPDEVKPKVSSESRPKIKKRTTILEKSFSEKSTMEMAPGENQIRRVPSTINPVKPAQGPSVGAMKKPTVPSGTEPIVEKPRPKVDGAPPKRPNNPPPPIPSFDKLKETLDQKIQDPPSSKSEPPRKPVLPIAHDTPKSADNESVSKTEHERTHRHSSSDVNHESTLF